MAFPPKRILVATDFSSSSKKAADLAVELARTYGATVSVTHVLPLSHAMASTLSLHDNRHEVFAFERSLRRHADQALEAEIERLHSSGVEVTAQLLEGPTSPTICEASRDADLVVIATNGRTGFSRLALGSVTESVVRASHAPVLTVRADAH